MIQRVFELLRWGKCLMRSIPKCRYLTIDEAVEGLAGTTRSPTFSAEVSAVAPTLPWIMGADPPPWRKVPAAYGSPVPDSYRRNCPR